MDAVFQDFRRALRSLLRRPGMSIVIVLTSAVGIGACSALFTYLTEIHRPRFEAPETDRLFYLKAGDSEGGEDLAHSMPDLLDLREALDGLGEFRSWSFLGTVAVLPSGESLYTFARAIEPGHFEKIYGRRPHLGRSFLPEENAPGGERVVVVDHGFWQRRLGADPEIVGKTLRIGRRTYTVVGVTPRGFQDTGFPLPFYVPAVRLGELTLRREPFTNRDERAFFALLRLDDDADREIVQARLDTFAAVLDAEHPLSGDVQRRLVLEGVEEYDSLPSQQESMLAGAVVFLLLLSCANVANLLLAHGAGRRKEIAIYAALGADAARIVRRLLLESVMLALAGGALGIVLGRLLVDSMRSFLETLPVGMAGWAEGAEWMRMDERALLFTLVLSLLTGLLFGLAPALAARRVDLTGALGGSAPRGGGRFSTRRVLVVAQVLLSTILVLGAALLQRSLHDLGGRPLGFTTEDKLIVAFSAARDGGLEPLPRREQERRLYELGRTELEKLPGVVDVALISEPPGIGARTTRAVFVGGRTTEGKEEPQVTQTIVDEHFFSMMEIPVRGRDFEPSDQAGKQGVAIVNQEFIREYYDGEDALGREIRLPDLSGSDVPDARYRIVGVVPDIVHGSRRNPPHSMIYLPLRQAHRGSRQMLIVKARGDRAAVRTEIEKVASTIHPDLAFIEVGTFEDQLAFDLSEERLHGTAATLFGIFGLGLACLGVYGVMSYSVGARVREIGIRKAVGARDTDISSLILGEAVRLVGLGIVLGLGVSLLLGRWLQSLLFGVSAHDPTTFVAVALVLMLVALASAWPAAARAERIDPLKALRQD